MLIEIDGLTVLFEKIAEGAKILRVFGSYSNLKLPESITCDDGTKLGITEIGDYCFASRVKLNTDQSKELVNNQLGDGNTIEIQSSIRPLSGEYLESIILPESLKKIGDYAFYGCRNLIIVTINNKLAEIGCDIFMNCKKLNQLIIKNKAGERTILPKLLSQINSEIEVSFMPGEGCEVRVLYPQYTESYELLGPAHIFSLNLEGEGYRARKQFKDDIIDLEGYDLIFAKASHEERFETLMRMAIDRLSYPYSMTAEAKNIYEAYVRENEGRLIAELVKRNDIEGVLSLLNSGVVSAGGKKEAVEAAIEYGKTAMVSQIISGGK